MGATRVLSDLFSRAVGRLRDPSTHEQDEFCKLLDKVVTTAPSNQNMVDVISGWNHALPPEVGVTAGAAILYDDQRIHWAIEQFGSIDDCDVLELGPLEGSHTYLLDRYKPARIDAIEANRLAYFRCLIVKNMLELNRAHFHLGNFIRWLEDRNENYDLIIASGVLYHMEDPVRFLELMAQRTDAIYLWTHYFSEDAMPPGDLRRRAFSKRSHVVASHGVEVRLHERSYHGAWKSTAFCGGPTNVHYWIERPDLLRLLGAFGLSDVRVSHDEPAHRNGPSFSVFARRT